MNVIARDRTFETVSKSGWKLWNTFSDKTIFAHQSRSLQSVIKHHQHRCSHICEKWVAFMHICAVICTTTVESAKNVDFRLQKNVLLPFLTICLFMLKVTRIAFWIDLIRSSVKTETRLNDSVWKVNYWSKMQLNDICLPHFSAQTLKLHLEMSENLQTIHIWSLPFFPQSCFARVSITFHFFLVAVCARVCMCFLWLHIETNKRLQNNEPESAVVVYWNVCLVQHCTCEYTEPWNREQNRKTI